MYWTPVKQTRNLRNEENKTWNIWPSSQEKVRVLQLVSTRQTDKIAEMTENKIADSWIQL